MRTITIGVDLAKLLFSICEVDPSGRVVQRKDLRRNAFAAWLAQLPADTFVAMEACSGAHYWARLCQAYGLQPRLMAAQFVKPFRKSCTTKNDRNDTEAVATAARQGNMRFVPVKSVDQQARLAWHRVGEGHKTEALAVGNRLRGLLAEFGIVVAKSEHALRRTLADVSVLAKMPATMLALLDDLYRHWQQVRDRIAFRCPGVLLRIRRGAFPQRAVRSYLVVVQPPCRDNGAGVVQRDEPVFVEALVAELPVEAELPTATSASPVTPDSTANAAYGRSSSSASQPSHKRYTESAPPNA